MSTEPTAPAAGPFLESSQPPIAEYKAMNHAASTEPAVTESASAEPSKVQIKEQKQFEKVLNKDAKQDEKHLKSITKGADRSAKDERKALKAQEKAKRAHEKATQKEYKYKQALLKAQNKHTHAASDLEKAKKDMDLKIAHHNDLVNKKAQTIQELEQFKAAKTSHDHERAAKIEQSQKALQA